MAPLKVVDSKDTGKNNPYAPPMPSMCFHCGEAGHRSNQCPQCQGIALTTKDRVVEDEYLEGQKEDADDDDEGILNMITAEVP